MAHRATIAKTEQFLANLRADDGSSATNRADLLRQLDDLRRSLQTPPDSLILIIINACVELGVFSVVPPDTPTSITSIAETVGVDASILSRFLNALVLEGFFTQPSPGAYSHTPASLALHDQDSQVFWKASVAMPLDRVLHTATYLRTHTLAQTRDPTQNAYSWSLDLQGLSFFEALERDDVYGQVWKRSMELTAKVQFATGMFPWQSLKEDVAKSGRAFVVDVGGGRGNALVEITKECEKHGFTGEMVLQDLARTLEGVSIEGVRNVPYDSFTDLEQPIKDAHVYYLRKVLHDYYDNKARHILQQTVNAMGPASRVILNEYILPSEEGGNGLGKDIFPFLMDFSMFICGGKERNEKQWRELLDSVGLEVVHIWRHPDTPVQADIECRLKSSQ
ncbi:Demethylsterigmatocystin 6-O-methyltransferase [Diplogelasinospora grovesii]|uniref:Demethylsterigmatocystin 6-O-methyltransferase n=1 Tax=Diplogelasinospora grovesii TaxID=303347 RepID=A0AAN6NBS8_9PEZI|nr:Demethylsterigmatocystin 6-O-methyltransferase [Diplogelasinospora grovesii]